MTGSVSDGAAAQARPSTRVALARLAHDVVAQLPAAALTAGPDARWLTSDASRRIRGVQAVAAPDGRFELALHLVVAWPPGPLDALAGDLRRRVRAAARRAGLEADLGEVQIHIDDVHGPGDPRPAPQT